METPVYKHFGIQTYCDCLYRRRQNTCIATTQRYVQFIQIAQSSEYIDGEFDYAIVHQVSVEQKYIL